MQKFNASNSLLSDTIVGKYHVNANNPCYTFYNWILILTPYITIPFPFLLLSRGVNKTNVSHVMFKGVGIIIFVDISVENFTLTLMRATCPLTALDSPLCLVPRLVLKSCYSR